MMPTTLLLNAALRDGHLEWLRLTLEDSHKAAMGMKIAPLASPVR